jgi:alkylated DNA repair dioxygenase AlkB
MTEEQKNYELVEKGSFIFKKYTHKKIISVYKDNKLVVVRWVKNPEDLDVKDNKVFYCPDGLIYKEDVIVDKEKELFDFLDEDNGKKWKYLSNSKNSRKVQHYGYLYNYKSGSVKEKGDNIPKEFQFLIDALNKECLEKLGKEYNFNQVIVNNYDPGQGISAHTDVKEYGEVIGCYTIGSGATMLFTKGDDIMYDLYVKKNSLYIMSGDSRYKWKHEMSGRKTDMVNNKRVKRDRRISITFRYVDI